MTRHTFTAAFLFVAALFSTVVVNAQALTGNYSIDATQPTAGTNFQSFTDFSNSLTANGVDGNVVATVAAGSGPYTEQVVFQNIAGLGANATLTIDGNGETITSDTAILIAGSNPNRHILRFIGVQYVTVNNLDIDFFAGSTGFIGIHFLNSGHQITISNCNVDMNPSISTLVGAFVFNGAPASILTPGGDFDSISIHSNTTTGGGYGVSVIGQSSLNLATNVEIFDNAFTSHHTNGVYLRETNGAVIRDNHFDKASAQAGSCDAIDIAQASNQNAQIYRNFIQVSQTNNPGATIRGIYVSDGTGHKIYNNVIHNVKLTKGNFIGIEVRNPGTEIYFNTISLDNPLTNDSSLIGISEELPNTGTTIRNNIISITQPGAGWRSAFMLFSTSTIATAFNSDHNVVWIPDGNVAQKGSSVYTTLAQWQSASTQDVNSLNIDPQFVAVDTSIATNPLVDNAGIAIAGITDDVVGVVRQNPPTVGAYEVPGCDLPLSPTALLIDSLVCEGSMVTFSVNPVIGATSYAWEVPVDATITSGQGTSEVTILFGATSGNVVVFVNDSCGTSLPSSFNVTVELCSGIENTATGEGMRVYPNPFTDNALVEVQTTVMDLNVRVLDHTGRVVKTFASRSTRFVIERNDLVDGVYFIEALSGKNVIAREKVVVQ